MSKKAKVFTVILAAILFVVSLNMIGLAESDPDSKTERVQEIVDKRTLSSKTYLMSNGAYQCAISSGNIHYAANDGTLQDIQNAVVPKQKQTETGNYAFANKANAFNAWFGDIAEGNYPVLLEYEGHEIALAPVEAAVAKVVQPSGLYKDSPYQEFLMDSDSVLYQSIYPGVDLSYTVLDGELKENIILRQKPESNTFTFRMDVGELDVTQDAEGNYLFINDKSEVVFYFAPLYAVDYSGAETSAVYCEIKPEGDVHTVTITVDAEYLNSADRNYPVYVDPSMMITGANVTYDTFIASGPGYPALNFNSGTNMPYLKTGFDPTHKPTRTLIKFSLPNDIQAHWITSSSMRMRKHSEGTLATTVRAYRITTNWTSSTVSWNTFPSNGYDSGQSVQWWEESNNWYKFNVTSTIKYWLNFNQLPDPNYGFLVKDDREDVYGRHTVFYSSDAPSPNKPELWIYYNQQHTPTPFIPITPAPTVAPTATPVITPVPTVVPTPTQTPIPVFTLKVHKNSQAWAISQGAVANYIAGASSDFFAQFGMRFEIEGGQLYSSSALNKRLANDIGGLCTVWLPSAACDKYCGTVSECKNLHHQSALYLNTQVRGSNAAIRYVDYYICNYDTKPPATHVGGASATVLGLTAPDRYNITIHMAGSYVRRTTLHEISHLFGADDNACPPSEANSCIMTYTSGATKTWCSQCTNTIQANVNNWR